MTPEESEDARMAALFGDLPRPPMGDEDFVRSVMGRVQEARVDAAIRRNAIGLGVIAATAGLLWPFKSAIVTAVTLPLAKYLPSMPAMSAGATGLLIAAVASVAALAYAERS